MTITQQIIDFINRNRVSTTEAADALGKAGVMRNVLPMTPDLHKVGRVRTVFTNQGSNFGVHDQICAVEEGEIVIVCTHECDDLAILGDLITKYVVLYRGAAALVVDGLVRDAARIKRERHPVWATGVTPLGCVNDDRGPFPADREAELKKRYDGGVAVCDDGGVVVIPSDCLDQDMLERLHRIELQEDVWEYCLDTLKWNTKKTICERAYLELREQLPPPQRDMIDKLEKRFTKKI